MMKKVLFLIPLILISTSCKKNSSSNVLEYELKADNTYRVFLSENSKEKSITIPKTYNKKEVSEISGFRKNDYLEKVKFYGNIKKIDEGSFTFCTNLKSITVSNSSYYSSSDGILYENDNILVYPSGKTDQTLTITKNVKRRAFTLAPNLKKIIIKSDKIDEYSFYYMENLDEIIIDNDAKVIDKNFFYGFEPDKVIIKNETLTKSLSLNYAKKIYAKEYVSLSNETLEHYTKTGKDTIDGIIYEIYEIK